MKTLVLRGVAVRFGRVQALAGVDLRVRAGEVVMLAGPNGAGKSTLIGVMLGLVSPSRGCFEIDGLPRGADSEFKARVGYLPESVAFTETLTGRQICSFFVSARGVDRAAIDRVLTRVGLAAAARRRIRGYSRGMRQRLGLALAILHEPDLLVLDEPTGGLDQEGLALLDELLGIWRTAGRMVLVSSHDLGLLEAHVDRMVVLRAGRVLVAGTPEELRAEAALPVRVRVGLAPSPEFADDAATLRAELEGLAGVRVERVGERLAVRVPPRDLVIVMRVCAAHPGVVAALRVVEPGLEAVYQHLLERDLGRQGVCKPPPAGLATESRLGGMTP